VVATPILTSPSRRKVTDATATLSLAAAERSTAVPVSVLEAVGVVRYTAGGVVSPPPEARVVKVSSLPYPVLPRASAETASKWYVVLGVSPVSVTLWVVTKDGSRVVTLPYAVVAP
jgi:hypothetical protein